MIMETIDGILTLGVDTEGGGPLAGAVNIKDEGVLLPNTPFPTIDFVGGGVTVTQVSPDEAKVTVGLTTVSVEQFLLEDLSESSTNAILYQNKASLIFTPVLATHFLFLIYAEFSMDTNTISGKIRIRLDSGPDLAEIDTIVLGSGNPYVSDIWKPFMTFFKTDISLAQHIVDLDWKSLNIAATAYIRRAKLFALGIQ